MYCSSDAFPEIKTKHEDFKEHKYNLVKELNGTIASARARPLVDPLF